jgi:hypothetical protein
MVLGRVGFIAGMLLVGHWPGAAYDLVFLAPSFDRQLRARYETLDALSRSGETTAAVERLSVRPESLSFDDVGDQSAHTEFVARYFGLSGLTVTVDGKPWSPEARP